MSNSFERHRGRRFEHALLAGVLVAMAGSGPPAPVRQNQQPAAPESRQPAQSTVDGGGRPVAMVPPPPPVDTKQAPVVVELASFPDTVFGIPASVLAAYRRAADANSASNPRCHLTWAVLAGIGKVESNHAHGGDLDANGTARHPILGPVLDGTRGTAAIRDTDNGMYDHDTVWDRAVGPMQFIPSTWAVWGTGGNGKPDPQNVYDATLSAAYYLCAHGRELSTPDGLRAAILSYNGSLEYLNVVLRWIAAYERGGVAVPDGFGSPTPPATTTEPSSPPANQPPEPSPAANPPPEPTAPAKQPAAPATQPAAPTSQSSEPAPPQRPAPSSPTSASTTPPNPVSRLLDGLAGPLAGMVNPKQHPSEAHP